MATIRERLGKFQVSIRKKGIEINRTFDKEESAQLYAVYKERLIDEIAAFEVPINELCTLGAAIDLKINHAREEGLDRKSILDIEGLKKDFSEFIDSPVSIFSHEILFNKAKKMLETVVIKGGTPNVENSGHQRIQSPITVLKKMRCLSSVFGNLIRLGMNVKNEVPNVTFYLSSLIKEHEGNRS